MHYAYKHLFILVRITLGVALLSFGIIALFIPLLPGIFPILIAVPLINPEYGRKFLEKTKLAKKI